MLIMNRQRSRRWHPIQGTLPNTVPAASRLTDFEDVAAATSWMSEGMCSQTDPETFFAPDDAGPNWYTDAITVCQGCPIRSTCLAYAIENGIEYGVWGGSTEADRRRWTQETQAA
jgi:WhiB family transcriptional regulator, redox-sensing transcriptional regulator